MMVASWGHQPWLARAFIGVGGMGVLGGVVTLRRTRRLRAALAADTGSDLSGALRSVLSGRVLTASLRLRIAISRPLTGPRLEEALVGRAPHRVPVVACCSRDCRARAL